MSRIITMAGDLGDAIYSMCAIKAMGGGDLRFWTRSYVREPMTPAKVDKIASFFASQPYIHSVGYDNSIVAPMANLDDFRSLWMKLRKNGTHSKYNLAELFLLTFHLPLELAREKWLDIPAGPHLIRPSVIYSRSFRYRNPKFPWKMVHDKYRNVACMVSTPEEWREFVGNVGDIPYIATPTLMEAAQLISTAKLVVTNQNAIAAISVALQKPTVMEVWPQDPNCIFPCVIPGFDDKVKLPDL